MNKKNALAPDPCELPQEERVLVFTIEDPNQAGAEVDSVQNGGNELGALGAVLQYVESHERASLVALYPDRALDIIYGKTRRGNDPAWQVALPDSRSVRTRMSGIHFLRLESSTDRAWFERRLTDDPLIGYVHQPGVPQRLQVRPAQGLSPHRFQWGPLLCGFQHVWRHLDHGYVPGAIGVIDDGPLMAHPDLLGRVTAFPAPGTPSKSAHATAVAGMLAAQRNGADVDGCCSAHVNLYSVWNADGYCPRAMYEALRHILDDGVRVANISLWFEDALDPTIERQINECLDAGIILVASMGNAGDDVPLYPAAYDRVIAVGATNIIDQRAQDSNFGDHICISAPGEHIDLLSGASGTFRANGNSFSAPMVTAAAWLALRANRNLSIDEVRALLTDSVAPCSVPSGGFSPEIGFGRLDMCQLLKRLTGRSC